jgi:hypothetical protein
MTNPLSSIVGKLPLGLSAPWLFALRVRNIEGDGHMLVGDAYLVLERQTEISMRQKSEPKVVADR